MAEELPFSLDQAYNRQRTEKKENNQVWKRAGWIRIF